MERKSYDPPAVVYETELEVHASSSTSSSSPDSVFDLLDPDKKWTRRWATGDGLLDQCASVVAVMALQTRACVGFGCAFRSRLLLHGLSWVMPGVYSRCTRKRAVSDDAARFDFSAHRLTHALVTGVGSQWGKG